MRRPSLPDAVAALVFQTALLLPAVFNSSRAPRALTARDTLMSLIPLVFALALYYRESFTQSAQRGNTEVHRARHQKSLCETLYFLRALCVKPFVFSFVSFVSLLKKIAIGTCAGLLMFPVSYALTIFTHDMATRFGYPPPSPQWIVESLRHPGTTLAAKAVAAVSLLAAAPVAEEILNRWAIAGTLARRIHPALAAFASALFFTLLHFNLSSSLALFALGMVLSALYFRTRSLAAPIAAHAAFNAANFAAFAL